MVDWKSPETIALQAVIFVKFCHVISGVYLWEWLISLNFDWDYLTGKKKFRWPLFFYFLCRYSQLLAIIGLLVAFNNTTKEINCQAFYGFNAAMGNISIGAATINLSLRTMAVWGRKWYIVVPLTVLILGHWSLLLHGILLKAMWVPAQGCVITEANNTILSATFIYSMSLDFIVLCLTGFKLFYLSVGRSRIVNLIVRDGLMFFIVAFLVNLIAVVFMQLNLNPIMSVIANVPAGTAATIVACRAVRRLVCMTTEGCEMFTGGTRMTGIAFKTNGSKTVIRTPVAKDGVHVQTNSSDKYDVAGNIVSTGTVYDAEDQAISGEFKRGAL